MFASATSNIDSARFGNERDSPSPELPAKAQENEEAFRATQRMKLKTYLQELSNPAVYYREKN